MTKPFDKPAGRIGRKLKVIYERVDQTIREINKDHHVSCEEKCDHCCYLSVAMSIPEGLAILDRLSRDPMRWWEFRKSIPQIRKWTGIVENRETTRESWFASQTPCLFLNDHKCSIYPVRPVACRTHISVDDPVLCSHETGLGTKLRFVDLQFIEDFVWKEGQRFVDREHMPLGYGPMPAVMLWSYIYWTRGRQGFRKAIEGTALADGDMPNLMQWIHLIRNDPKFGPTINKLLQAEIPNGHAESSTPQEKEDHQEEGEGS